MERDQSPRTQNQPVPSGRLTVERAASLLHVLVRQQMRGRDRLHRESLDVVQSIAVDLLSHASGFLELDPESQRKYLRVVVRHKLAQLARGDGALKRGGRKSGRPLDTAGEPASSVSGPATHLVAQSDLAIMREALEALEPETRSVLTLHAAGVSHDAIAILFETTDEATRQRFVRAKRDLIIIARRAGGAPWSEIAEATGLTPERAKARHDRLRAPE